MATAWYKPHALPKLLRSFPRHNNNNSASPSIEVWNTTCIVRKFGKPFSNCKVLINPSNPSLLGVTKFPYFPRGGPEPKTPPNKDEHHIMGYVTKWGGMDLRGGMLFPRNVIDGLVHESGGWRLRWQLKWMLPGGNEKCPVGKAVSTGPGGLRDEYDRLVHTVPPFYQHDSDPKRHLADCYRNALSLGFSFSDRVACPLLGAGGRGFPLDVAIEIAARESVKWRNDASGKLAVAFGIPDKSIAEALMQAIDHVEQDEGTEWRATNKVTEQ